MNGDYTVRFTFSGCCVMIKKNAKKTTIDTGNAIIMDSAINQELLLKLLNTTDINEG